MIFADRGIGLQYLSVAEIAKAWGISERSVRNYCAQGRVPGAMLEGKAWRIPEDARKPVRANARYRQKNALLERLRQEKAAKTKGGIYHKIQVELTYNSNHIEGSQLSIEQTRMIFETATIGMEGVARVDDIVETSNHFRAIDFIIDNAEKPLTQRMMKKLHRILKIGTTDAEQEWFNVGDYKALPNEVGGLRTCAPEAVESEMAELLNSYGPRAKHAFEEILDFHVRLERIHPFQDGNGRVGRLLMFKECLASGIVPFVIEDDERAFYYRGLAEWDEERGFLRDTCLAAQDRFKEVLDYFRIPYEEAD